MKIKISHMKIHDIFKKNIVKIDISLKNDILGEKEPVAYTADVRGWTADVYVVGRYAVLVGRRPFGRLPTAADLQELKSLK